MQKQEIKDEDRSTNKLVQHSNSYYWFTVFQIIIVISVSVYHVFSFRSFLRTKNIIS